MEHVSGEPAARAGAGAEQLEQAILRHDAGLLRPEGEARAPEEVERPVTSYARSGDVNIAYQVAGTGPFDLVYVPGAFSHVELNWTIPARASFLDRLVSFSRTITFDKRGTGMPTGVPGEWRLYAARTPPGTRKAPPERGFPSAGL